MSALSQPKVLGDWLKFEEDNYYCRKAVTILSGEKLVSGAVVAARNDGANAGKIVAYDGDGANGIDVAVGLLVEPIDASATGTNADTAGTIIARGPASINPDEITFASGQSSVDDIPEALADLLALGIVSQEGA